MKKGIIISIVIVIVLIVLIVGGILLFSDRNSNNNQNSGIQNNPGEIVIKNFAFNPNSMTIKAGDSVKWINEDTVTHTVNSDTGSELDSGELSPGDEYSHTFNTPGTYTYHCNIHTTMKGTIIVE